MISSKLILENDSFKLSKAVLQPVGVNTYFLENDANIIVIDPGLGSKKILNSDSKKSEKKISIILTHCHFDHISGVGELKEFEIYACEETLKGLFDSEYNLSYLFGNIISYDTNDLNVSIIQEGENKIGDIDFRSLILPGHTQGDTVFDFGSIIFTGDVLFKDSIGRTDFPYSSEINMYKSLGRLKEYLLMKENDAMIFPGHLSFEKVEKVLKINPFMC